MEDRWYGIFLILPAPERAFEVEDYAVRLIKRAIGYRVRTGAMTGKIKASQVHCQR